MSEEELIHFAMKKFLLIEENYIESFYNTRRIHSALDNKSPKEYEK